MTVRRCPACQSAERTTLAQIPAEAFCRANSTYVPSFAEILEIDPGATFPIGECRSCGFVYAEWLPDPPFLSRVYSEVIDPIQGPRESTRPGWVAHQLALGSFLLEHLETVFGPNPRLKILDFGCGFGTLVRALSGPNVTCVGFEIGERQLAYLSRNGLPHHASLEAVATDAPYHGVVLSDVLEHVAQPREVLRRCYGWLAPGGVLCVSVPQFERDVLVEQARRAVGGAEFSRTLNPWEHLNYFSTESLRALLTSEGFSLRPTSSTVDVGFRSTHRSAWERWGNCLKSMMRLLKFGMRTSREPGTTCLAQRPVVPLTISA